MKCYAIKQPLRNSAWFFCISSSQVCYFHYQWRSSSRSELGVSHGHGAGHYIWKPNEDALKRRQSPKTISGCILEAGEALPELLPPAAHGSSPSPLQYSCTSPTPATHQQPLEEECVLQWNWPQPLLTKRGSLKASAVSYKACKRLQLFFCQSLTFAPQLLPAKASTRHRHIQD